MKKHYKYILVGVFLLFAILGMWFVLATSAPTALVFGRNTTANYDEGNFSVNWSAGGADANNYTVYIAVSGSVFTTALNNSATGYSFNNWTEGNYSFIIGARNQTGIGNETNSTTNISIYVDRTAPVIAIPLYTNATAKKNTATLTLNVSVIDAKSGVTGSVCLIDVNGTSNQSVAVSGGWCNSTSISLAGTSDGNNIIKVYVNDTVNILGLNNTFYVVTDTTVPTASPTCSPATIETEDAFPCSCSGSDATAGLNSSLTSGSSTSPEVISTPTSSGVFTYTCSVTDNAGNSGSATLTYVVNQKAGSGSQSSTSAATVIPAHTFSTIVPGTPATKKYADSLGIGVKEIQIEVNSEAKSVKIAVTKYDSKPAAISVEKSGSVYQYLQIKVDNVEGKLSKATITTKVEKSWITENGLEMNNLALFKFDETAGQWNELSTTYSSEDNTYYYYASDVTSFSYFAIGAKSLVSSSEEGAETTGQEEATTNNLTWLWIVIAVIVLVAAAIVVVMRKKK